MVVKVEEDTPIVQGQFGKHVGADINFIVSARKSTQTTSPRVLESSLEKPCAPLSWSQEAQPSSLSSDCFNLLAFRAEF